MNVYAEDKKSRSRTYIGRIVVDSRHEEDKIAVTGERIYFESIPLSSGSGEETTSVEITSNQ